MATTRTDNARTGSPEKSHAAPAITSVTGMKMTAYRSATRTDGAFCFSASCTRRTMPAYVLSAAVATALSSMADPALTAPDRIWSPSGRSDGRDSPVSADSSKTPGVVSTPSTGTTSPVFTKSRSPGRTSSIGTDDQLAALVSRDHLRRSVEQRGELAVGSAIRVGLERTAAGEHQRDHGAGEVLAERQRAGHGQQRDEIDARLAPDQSERSWST